MRNNPLRVYGEELWDGTKANKVKVQGNMGGLAIVAIALEDFSSTTYPSAMVQFLDKDGAMVNSSSIDFVGKPKKGEKFAPNGLNVIPDEIYNKGIKYVTVESCETENVEIGIEYLPR